jgi:hypothetical protein
MAPKVDPSAPPTPLDFISARLAEKLFARGARSIFRRLADYPTPTRNSRILALLTICRDEFQDAWSYAQVGYIFNVNKGIVHRVRSQAMREIEHNTSRPPTLQRDQEAELIAYHASGFQDDPPLSEASPVRLRNLGKGTFVFMDMAGGVILPGGPPACYRTSLRRYPNASHEGHVQNSRPEPRTVRPKCSDRTHYDS